MGHRAQFIGSLPDAVKEQAGQHYDQYMKQHAEDPTREAWALTMPDVLTYGAGAALFAALARRGLYRYPLEALASKAIIGGVGTAAALIAAAYHTPALQDAKRRQHRAVLQHVLNKLTLTPLNAGTGLYKAADEKADKQDIGFATVPKSPSIAQTMFLQFGGTDFLATGVRALAGYAVPRMFGASNLVSGLSGAAAAASPWIIPQWQRVHRFVTLSDAANRRKAWNAFKTGFSMLLGKHTEHMNLPTKNTFNALVAGKTPNSTTADKLPPKKNSSPADTAAATAAAGTLIQ